MPQGLIGQALLDAVKETVEGFADGGAGQRGHEGLGEVEAQGLGDGQQEFVAVEVAVGQGCSGAGHAGPRRWRS